MTATGTPACAQCLDGLQAPRRGCGPGLHLARDCAVERGHRDGHLGEPAARHPRQDIDVAHDQRRLGDDADRVARPLQHLQHRARDAVLALDRLVGVGDGAERDELGHVARTAELALEQLGGIHLGVELGLEVEPGRVAEVAVRGTGVAIDAAVLAAAIGVDGLVEADVGAVVGRDDALGRLPVHIGLEGLEVGQALPAVVERLAQLALEPARPGSTGRRGPGAGPPRPGCEAPPRPTREAPPRPCDRPRGSFRHPARLLEGRSICSIKLGTKQEHAANADRGPFGGAEPAAV